MGPFPPNTKFYHTYGAVKLLLKHNFSHFVPLSPLVRKYRRSPDPLPSALTTFLAGRTWTRPLSVKFLYRWPPVPPKKKKNWVREGALRQWGGTLKFTNVYLRPTYDSGTRWLRFDNSLTPTPRLRCDDRRDIYAVGGEPFKGEHIRRRQVVAAAAAAAALTAFTGGRHVCRHICTHYATTPRRRQRYGTLTRTQCCHAGKTELSPVAGWTQSW